MSAALQLANLIAATLPLAEHGSELGAALREVSQRLHAHACPHCGTPRVEGTTTRHVTVRLDADSPEASRLVCADLELRGNASVRDWDRVSDALMRETGRHDLFVEEKW